MEPEYEKWMRENKPDLYKQMCEDRAWATQWRDDLIELLEPQVAELVAALRKWLPSCLHKPTCKEMTRIPPQPCDCGLSALLRRIEGGKDE